MQSIISIIKVNDEKKGVKDGREWALQDCECILLKEDNTPDQVGVLPLPKDLRGKVQPGTYLGTFALRADLRTRRIEAVLVGLQQYDVKRRSPSQVQA
ncbi:MAG: hypothetical protein AB7P37_18985 [Ramlibacter sp.]